MKVLVTGGNGFIGRYTVAELRARGHKPMVLDRHYDPDQPDADTFIADMADAIGVTEAMAHVDAFIHLAGVLGTQETITNPLPAAITNVVGGLNVLQAAAQYDVPGVNIAVGNHWMNNTYSITKSTVERFVDMYRVERGQTLATVRAYNAYGPGQSIAAPFGPSKVRKIMPAFICRALVGQPIEVYGDGAQIMDMVHVRDVAVALVDTLEAITSGMYDPAGEVVQAGTGRATTVNQIARVVQEAVEVVTGSTVAIDYLPMRPGEPDRSVVLADNPYRPLELIDLEDGVAETVAWYDQNWLPDWQRDMIARPLS